MANALDWLVGPARPLPLDNFGGGGALPLGNLGGGGALPLSVPQSFGPLPLTYVAPGQKKREAEEKKEKAKETAARAVSGQGRPAAQAAQGRVAAPGGDAGAQIVEMARQRYGPEGARVVGALLAAEGGLGGAVGDTNISAVGSHGPFQFYGPGGQLDNYARALGVDLPAAGAQARANPVGAAEWALNNYLGQAIDQGVQQGLSGEALLQRALSVQNPGALNSPAHYARYRDALTAPAPVPAAPPAVAPGGSVFPVVGYRGPISAHGGNRGGMDIMAPAGTPVVAMRGGTVTGAGNYPTSGGNYVEIRGDDGNLYYYAHMEQRPLVAPGQPVQAGTPLGTVGNTGNARNTPPHLHLGIGPQIFEGVDRRGGTGGDFDAQTLLRAAYEAALAAAANGAP